MKTEEKKERIEFGIQPVMDGRKPSERGVKPTTGTGTGKPPQGGTGQSNKSTGRETSAPKKS